MSSPSAPPPPPASSSEPSVVDRLGPDRLVLVVALVAVHGLVRIAERYLPEYLRALGYGPIVVGLLASLGLAVAVGVRFVDTEVDSSERGGSQLALAATLLGALGLLAWAGAPTLDSLLGTPLSAIGWLVVGVALLGVWHGWGPDETGRLRADRGHSSGDRDQEVGTGTRTRASTRTRIVAGALGLAGGAVLATAAFSGTETARAGFTLLVAAGSTVGLVATVALGVVRSTSRTDLRPTDDSANGETVSPHRSSLPALEDVREVLDSVPAETRWTIVGDTLVRLATAMTLPFVVLIVVEYHAVALTVGSVSLPPAALFGLLVLAEAVGATAGALAAPTLAARVDHRWLLAGGLVIPAMFPLALVAAPSSVVVLAALFALVGCRTALEPTRPTAEPLTHADARGSRRKRGRPRAAVPGTLRTASRVALVPAPLLGGVLYAIGPVAAFSLATTVGLLGVRELLRPLR